MGFLQVGTAASVWGLWSLFLRPAEVSAWVSSPVVFGTMGLACLLLIRADPPALWDRTAAWLLAANSVLDAVNMVTFFGAMEHTSVAIAVLTHYLAPILIALATPRVEGVRVPGVAFAAMLATAGLALMLEPWKATGSTLGAVLGTASAFAYAANVFVVRRLTIRIGAGRTMAFHSLIAAALILAAGSWIEPSAMQGVRASSIALLVVGAICVGSITGWMYLRGLAAIGAANAAVLTFLEPLVAVAVGWLVWKETLGAAALVGGAFILGAGVFVVVRSSQNAGRPGPAPERRER